MEGHQARARAAKARQLARREKPRERQHVEIMASVIESPSQEGHDISRAALTEYPRDAQVLSLCSAPSPLCLLGRADHDAARLAVCERYAGDYGDDWCSLTYLGWSQTEAATWSQVAPSPNAATRLKPETPPPPTQWRMRCSSKAMGRRPRLPDDLVAGEMTARASCRGTSPEHLA